MRWASSIRTFAHPNVRLIGVEAGGDGHRDRPPCGLAHGGPARRAARQSYLPAAGRERPDHARRIRCRPASTIPAWVPSTRGSRTPAARSTWWSTTREALAAFHDCCRIEGIIPALESAHALAYATKLAPTLPKTRSCWSILSGRGDKDMETVAERDARRGCVMNRIDAAFARLRAAGRTALIPYVTTGDPSLAATRADHGRAGRAPVPTSSSWACPFPTRWPTGR